MRDGVDGRAADAQVRWLPDWFGGLRGIAQRSEYRVGRRRELRRCHEPLCREMDHGVSSASETTWSGTKHKGSRSMRQKEG